LNIIRFYSDFLILEDGIFDRFYGKVFLYKIRPNKKEGEVYNSKWIFLKRLMKKFFNLLNVIKLFKLLMLMQYFFALYFSKKK